MQVTDLERGGKLIDWDGFVLQIGAYPETIKDTIRTGVPQLFLVPEQMFDATLGVSAAELEFPLYFNFFLKGRPLRFICRPRQLRSVWRVLKEAVFGPSHIDLREEYLDGESTFGYPDLPREMAYYKADPSRPRGRLMLKDMVVPLTFDGKGEVEVDGVRIKAKAGDVYELKRGEEIRSVSFKPRARPDTRVFDAGHETFSPPLFGVTTIGSGHGFDASSNTSGFLIWINGKGVLVDPPVDSTEWLRKNGIAGRLVEDVILTHTHADHDSGTLQKVLEEGRVRLHTTPTVLRAFVRKYRSLTGLSGEDLNRLYDYRQVYIAQPINIAGARFVFKYTLHPIPTLNFEVSYRGKTFAYSCDTLYDPDLFLQLRDQGVLSELRMQDLLSFNWNADLIIHEAGIPPIHTPMKVLAERPPEVKERMYLTHVSQSAIPADSGLRLAPPGPEATLRLEVTKPSSSNAEHRLDMLAHIDLFSGMEIGRAVEFLRITTYSRRQAGEVVVRQGDRGDCFYMIMSGEVDVYRNGEWLMACGRYDYFGEIAVVLDQPRVADVVARTDLELLSIGRIDFISFIQNTGLMPILRLVAHNKLQGAGTLLKENHHLGMLSNFQKTQLLADMKARRMGPGELLFKAGDRVTAFYLVGDGEVHIKGPGGHQAWLGRGALLGQLTHSLGEYCYESRATTTAPTTLYEITTFDMEHFFRRNPGTYVRVLRLLAPPNPSYLL